MQTINYRNATHDFGNSSTNPIPNATSIPHFLEQHVALTTWFAVSLCVSIFATPAYLVLLAVILSKKTLRSGSGILICHNIFLELMICFIYFPASWTSNYMAGFPGLRFKLSCKNLLYIFYATVNVQSWSDVFLALNRLVGILFPHHYGKVASNVAIIAMIVSSWIIGLGNTLPLYLRNSLGMLPTGCGLTLTEEIPEAYGAIGVILPAAVVGASYAAILVNLLVTRWTGKRVHPLVDKAQSHVQKLAKRRLQIAEMLLVTFIWHNICYLPYSLLAKSFPEVYVTDLSMQLWFCTLYCFGYAANPVIFFTLNEDYRKGLKQVLNCTGLGRDLQGSEMLTGVTPVTTRQSIALALYK